ncbi:unnamed protein product [Calypogeia fissa]
MGEDAGQGMAPGFFPSFGIPPAPSWRSTGEGISNELTKNLCTPPLHARQHTDDPLRILPPGLPQPRKQQVESIIEDFTASFPILPLQPVSAPPSLMAGSTASFPILPLQPPPASPRKRPSRIHHHWRSWPAPMQKRISQQKAKHREQSEALHEAMMAAAAEGNVNKLAKTMITATNMHTAAMMTSARIVVQALDRFTYAILQGKETASPQESPMQERSFKECQEQRELEEAAEISRSVSNQEQRVEGTLEELQEMHCGLDREEKLDTEEPVLNYWLDLLSYPG